jgi:CDGSH-type Zn-finger protein
MIKPRIAAREPVAVQLQAGKTIYWCACGLSKNQPYCDGSHKDTGFEPLAYTPEKSGEAWLCQCKRTGNAPLCDGTHNRLGPADEVDQL